MLSQSKSPKSPENYQSSPVPSAEEAAIAAEDQKLVDECTNEETKESAKIPQNILAMFKRHQIDPSDTELRNAIAAPYFPLVKHFAEKIWKRLPETVDVLDLTQDGYFGLLNAVDSFDLDRGVKFETFAAPRILGAILDGLRGRDWVARLDRSRSAKFSKELARFKSIHGRPPTDEEHAATLDLQLDDYYMYKAAYLQAHNQTEISVLTGKSRPQQDNDDELPIEAFRKANITRTDPFSDGAREVASILLDTLPENEREIMDGLLFRGWTLKHIGEIQDVSESQISQTVRAILMKLGRRVADVSHHERGTLLWELVQQYGSVSALELNARDDQMGQIDDLMEFIRSRTPPPCAAVSPATSPAAVQPSLKLAGTTGEKPSETPLDFGFTFFSTSQDNTPGEE